MKDYKVDVLVTATQEYFLAQSDWETFLKTWVPGWWESIEPKKRERYVKLQEQLNGHWNTVLTMCKLLDIDSDSLLSTVKAICRWEKNHGKYDRCLGFFHRDIERFQRFFGNKDEWAGYYRSTGRKMAA